MTRVYISSSLNDLCEEREAVTRWLENNGLEAVTSYGPSSSPLVQTCLDDVASCDLMVLLLGHRLGYVPPENNPEALSITHLEFRHATNREIQVIPLLTNRPDAKNSDLFSPEIMPRIKAFHDEVNKYGLPGQFDDLDELREQLSNGIERELERLNLRLPATGIATQFQRASRDLFTWPTTLPNGDWLEPPELAQWLSRFTQNEHSTTLLRGEPGCGKSALLARLGNTLAEQGVAVLGIKADLLPPGTKDIEKLAEAFGLSSTVEALVRRLAVDQPVVVLIDQLDAVADLVVQRPERLRVLLDLIQDLSGISNVHVLASCRSFERAHDRALRNLVLDEIVLQLPAWEAITAILLAKGVNSEAWSDEMRETVRSPHGLNAFLQLLTGTAEPDLAHGIHGLLEQQWQEHVINADRNLRRKRVMMALANGMAEEETLWLPTARLEDDFEALQALQRAGLLLMPEGEGRVGFRHQTWLEFLRGRSFLEQPGRLTETVLASQDRLRIRPQLWHALLYLRRADEPRYAHELKTLWANTSLRRHLRMLLIAFMGMQKAPLPCEEQIVWANFDDPWFQPRFLGAAMGSQGWFRALLPGHLPLLMQKPAEDSHLIRAVLDAIAVALPNEVLALLDQHWLSRPDMDALTWTLLVRSNVIPVDLQWLTRLERIAARTPISDWGMNQAVSMASTALPEQAPHLLKVWLELQWLEISRQDDISKALKIFLENARLHDLPAIAQAAPAAYARTLWPLLETFFAVNTRADEIHVVRYHPSVGYLDPWGAERFRELPEFLHSLCVAMETWGEVAATELCAFVREHEQSELLLLQRLLAMGLAKAAPHESAIALDYLLADPRRLSLGNLSDAHRESRVLMAQLIPYLDANQLVRLEQTISSWNFYRNAPDDDAKTRRARLNWNRESRLRLLTAIPVEKRSVEVNKRLERKNTDKRILGENASDASTLICTIKPPMSTEQMARAHVDDIVGLFAKLTDITGWQHPHRFMEGGAIQAGQALEKLLESNSAKALAVVAQLRPEINEIAVADVVRNLEVANLQPAEEFALLQTLVERGFQSERFQNAVAQTIRRLCSADNQAPEALLEQLLAWLKMPDPIPNSELPKDNEENYDSCLWGGPSLIVNGDTRNSVLLSAIAEALRAAKPLNHDRWLDILETHLSRNESYQTWAALMQRNYFQLLSKTNKERGQNFLNFLFSAFPIILNKRGSILSLYDLLPWISAEYAQKWLSLMAEQGHRGGIGSAELLLVRHVRWPQENWVTDAIEEILSSSDQVRLPQRVGLAHTVARLWEEAPLRELGKNYLLRCIPSGEKPVLRALARIFRMDSPWLPDAHTWEVLDALIAHPAIFQTGDGEYAVEVLEHLVRYEPDRSYRMAMVLIDTVADELANTATTWAYRSDALISIALALQDKGGEHSVQGAVLFERLLEFNVPAATEAAHKLDRRTPNIQSRQPARRRRFIK